MTTRVEKRVWWGNSNNDLCPLRRSKLIKRPFNDSFIFFRMLRSVLGALVRVLK
jgi:hypothetical protein